jgi:protein-S-isoprenylcysteine O-methyltransferase Ste14
MDLAKAARDRWVWGQLVLLLFVILAAPLVPRYVNLGAADFMLNRVDPSWIRWVGAGISIVGALLMAWGARSLGSALTPGTEPVTGAHLVTTGAFAHFRHPIYSGLVILVAGYTLVWSNWTLALVLSLLTRGYLQAKSRVEERRLLQKFPDYHAYMRYVQRGVL